MPPEPVIPFAYPISAVVGMDDVKTALECLLVNPSLRTVLICGEAGTAKSTVARAVAGISSKRLIECPSGIADEQLLGGIDIEKAVKTGETEMEPGLLHRADGNILCVDDIDLMDVGVLTSLFDAVLTGRVRIERGPISVEYGCDTVLIATMNSGESGMSPHHMDRFSICVRADTQEPRGRAEIVRRNIDCSRNPRGFRDAYVAEEDLLRKGLEKAAGILPTVGIPDELVDLIGELCARIGAQGSRGDLAVAGCSRALAALDNRDRVLKKDVDEAALLCLTHRVDDVPPPQTSIEDDDRPEEAPAGSGSGEPRDAGPPEDGSGTDGGSGSDSMPEDRPRNDGAPEDAEETVFGADEQFRVVDYIPQDRTHRKGAGPRKGNRALVESGDGTGKCSRYRVPAGATRDIAFGATILAAAPHQRSRGRNGSSLIIEKRDIREKVRRRRSGCTLLFLVDASGSLGVKRRMTTVKGTVMSMLRDSYIKRDRVGLMAFRRDSAEMILPPTRSVEYGYRMLEDLPTGGRTPLGEALVQAGSFMTAYSRCNRGEQCFIVLVTDGRANVPLEAGRDVNEEIRSLAEGLTIPGVRWIVVDAGARYPRFDDAEVLAADLGAGYFRLDDMNADRFAESIRSVIDG